MWKLADFGLTSEGTSVNIRMTEYARGSPGYRAPELLLEDNQSYTNKVDIWAMGCILHELVLGVKPFASDFAVLEHYRSKSQIELHFDDTFREESVKKLTAFIRKMLHNDHSSRPAAQTLLAEFIAFCQTEQGNFVEAPGLRQRETTVATNTEDTTNTGFPLTVFRWTDPPVLASTWNSGLSDRWVVVEVMVNKSNTRYVVSSCSNDNMLFRCTLLDTNSGEVKWTKEEEWTETEKSMPHPKPTFSEDGNHVVVYFDGSVEVLDAESADVVHAWDVSSFSNVSGVAVKRNGTRICLIIDNESTTGDAAEPSAVLTTKVVKSRTMPKGCSPIDVIITAFISDVTLSYGGDGRHLCIFGKSQSAQDSGGMEAVRFFWECISRRLLVRGSLLPKRVGFYNERASPLYATQIDHLPQFVYTFADTSRFWSVLLYSTDGPYTTQFSHTGALVIGYSPSGCLVFLKDSIPMFQANLDGSRWLDVTSEKEVHDDEAGKSSLYIWKWHSKLFKPTRWGKVLWDKLPPLQRVKAFAETEKGLTLILEDGKLFFLTRVAFTFLHIR